MRTLLIGGTGSFSTRITEKALERGHDVLVYARGLRPLAAGLNARSRREHTPVQPCAATTAPPSVRARLLVNFAEAEAVSVGGALSELPRPGLSVVSPEVVDGVSWLRADAGREQWRG